MECNIHTMESKTIVYHDIIKWKHFPYYRPFVREIHRSPGNFPHRGQWLRALMFSVICAWTNGWVNNLDVGDFWRLRAHYDVIVLSRDTKDLFQATDMISHKKIVKNDM